MPVHNADIVAVFNEIADLLDIQGDNPFRIRAYRNAARTVQDLGRELRDLVEKGEDLTTLQGIGADLAAKIKEMIETGKVETLDKLRKQLPPAITELLRIPGLGPKRVKTLWKDLKIESLEQLAAAAREGKIRDLDGFGEKTEQHILDSIKVRADTGRRFIRAVVVPYAEALVAYLQETPGVSKVTVAGSYRRAKETVGDLDILAVAGPKSTVMDQFATYDEVADVLSHGETKSSVVLKSGIQVDLRVVEPRSFGAALHYFTGSKAHNIAIRKLGQQRGLKVNEYGVFSARGGSAAGGKGEKYLAGKTEEEIYDTFGLAWIPPELREDAGEIDAARERRLPHLVDTGDIRGDLHAHTTASDGQQTIREMALAAHKRGYEYLAITEHSQRLAMVGGLDEKRLRAQMKEIDQLNGELKGITILKGIEVDILQDGKLDLPDSVLRELDVVILSVHSQFKLPADKQTERILRAMDKPYATILGHPTGRLLLEREPYDVDLPRVLQHARERGCFIELNAHPLRLDLDDSFCRMAKDEGVLVSINTDAHNTAELGNMRYGVGQARRGWLEKKDVLNTRTLKQLQAVLGKRG
ncbi:MAG: DNA polymerase/3'-5' exonuclease PolX [Verrucomicrobiota bacterium]